MAAERAHSASKPVSEALVQAASKLLASRKRAVLLVEDTAAHAVLIRRALSGSNWELEHVTRAEQALDSFRRDSERLILLDLSLPDSDGLELIGRFQTIASDAVIVVVTAKDQVESSVEAMRRGAANYVLKADPDETMPKLLQALEDALEKRIRRSEDALLEQTRVMELVRAERLQAIELTVRTVCHEVNNPLSGVVALSQLLKSHAKKDVDLQQLVEGICQSAQQVAEVVQKLRGINDRTVEFGARTVLNLEPEVQTNDLTPHETEPAPK